MQRPGCLGAGLRSGMDQAPWVMNDTVTNSHKLLRLPQLLLASNLPCNAGIGNLRFRSNLCCISDLASLSFRFAAVFEVSMCVSASLVRCVYKMCERIFTGNEAQNMVLKIFTVAVHGDMSL